MQRFQLAVTDLSVSRFAISPAFELETLLRVLQGLVVPGLPTTWAGRLANRFARMRRTTDLDAVLVLQSPGAGVDFLCPPPGSLQQTWEEDLELILRASPQQARAQIAHALRGQPAPSARIRAVLEAPDVVERLGAALAAAWDTLLAPDWPTVQAICERDVLHRAHLLTTSGWSAALQDLHPQLRWSEGILEVDDRNADTTTHPGRGLLLVPSVFISPYLAVRNHDADDDEPGLQALVYPARGSASLMDDSPSPSAADLAALVGHARARLLLAIVEPASTTQLARQLSMSPGAVGDHLAILLRTGMVTRARAGRSMLYRRSALGDAVIEGREPASRVAGNNGQRGR